MTFLRESLFIIPLVAAFFLGLALRNSKFATFLQESDGLFSWGRVAGCFTVAASIYMAVRIVEKTGAIDGGTLTALAAFGVFPFGVSKGIAAAAKPSAGM